MRRRSRLSADAGRKCSLYYSKFKIRGGVAWLGLSSSTSSLASRPSALGQHGRSTWQHCRDCIPEGVCSIPGFIQSCRFMLWLSFSPGITATCLHLTPGVSAPFQEDAKIREFLWALPMRADIEGLLLTESYQHKMKAVCSEVQHLSDHITTGESSVLAIERRRVSGAETHTPGRTLVALQLHLKDLEDRSRSNNLRLHGLPEATGSEDLRETAVAIFRVLDTVPLEPLELNQVHRVLSPKSTDPNRPRDVICRLHRYTHKKMILMKAWTMRTTDFDSDAIKILPVLSKATLQRRALLWPLLDQLQQLGHFYHWEFPFSLTVHKGTSSFTLHRPAVLPDLFAFLEIPPISVPDWFQPLPFHTQRSGLLPTQPGLPPHSARSRCGSSAYQSASTRES